MPGQVLGVVGGAGCGKSVTMRAILQLIERPGRITKAARSTSAATTSGVVDLAQLPPRGAEMRDIRGGEIALIPQEPMAAFSPVHTVGDQIVEAILLHSHRWQPDRKLQPRRGARHHGRPVPRRRHLDARAAHRRLFLAALGRPAPARHDRHGAVAASRGC